MKRRIILSESELKGLIRSTINKNLLYEAPQNYTIQQLQTLLNSKGYSVGIADGKAGENTLKGINGALSKVAPTTTTGGGGATTTVMGGDITNPGSGNISTIPIDTKTATKITTAPTESGYNVQTKTNTPNKQTAEPAFSLNYGKENAITGGNVGKGGGKTLEDLGF